MSSAEGDLQVDGGRQRAAQQLDGLRDRGGEVGQASFRLLAPGEAQDAVDHVLAAQCGVEQPVEVLAGFVVRALAGELGVAHDRAEDVVEVVRDAAGEDADRFHLLRVAQLVLEAHAFGLGLLARADVHDGAQHEHPLLGHHRREADLDGHLGAVLVTTEEIPPAPIARTRGC